MLFAVPVQVVLGFRGKVREMDLQSGPRSVVTVIVVKPAAGGLVAFVVDVDV